MLLIPVALFVEGAPPALTPVLRSGLRRTSRSIATAVAYVAWFTGLRRLPAGVVGVVGLLNPVTGVVLGVALAGEAFGLAQGVGLALVLGGIALGSLPPIRRRRAATPDPCADAVTIVWRSRRRGRCGRVPRR